MAVFKYELRQFRNYIITWSVTLGILIFFMLPTYIGFLSGNTVSPEMFSGNDFYESIGANMKYLIMPVGVYGFLTSFALIAGGINGVHMGLWVFTKEYMQKTADFLMTKPFNRTKIYFLKILSAIFGMLIIGASYTVGAYIAILVNVKDNFDFRAFWLISLSFFLMQLFCMGLGVLIGTSLPKIRTPLALSSGVAFLLYIVGTFSRKTGIVFTKFLSPYIYFDSGHIIETGCYDFRYMIAYIVFLIGFILISYNVFIKKDVIIVS